MIGNIVGITPERDEVFGLRGDWFDPSIGDLTERVRKVISECRHIDQHTQDDLEADFHEKSVLATGSRIIEGIRIAFLESRVIEWKSPIDGEVAPIVGGIAHPSNVTYYFVGGRNPCTLIVPRYKIGAIYYHRQNVFVRVSQDRYLSPNAWRSELKGLLGVWLSERSVSEHYASLMREGKLVRSLLLGDLRPSHYLSQSLNAIGEHVLGRLETFERMGGSISVIKENCFIPPFSVYPELSRLPHGEVSRSTLTERAMREGLFFSRFIRYGSDKDFSAVRSYVGSTSSGLSKTTSGRGGTFGVWVTVEAEKQRFRNQVPALAAALDAIGDQARRRGEGVEVLWDGWTVTQDELSGKDEDVIGKIRVIRDAVVAACRHPFESRDVYGVKFLEKLKITRGASIALSAYGTASMISSLIGGVRTISYGVADFVGKRQYIDTSHSLALVEPQVIPVGEDGIKPDLRCYEVTPDIMVEEVEKMLDAIQKEAGPVSTPVP